MPDRPATPPVPSLAAAMQLHQQGQWLAAEAAYQAIVAAQPDALQALQLLAVVQMQRGQPSRAVTTLQ